MAQETVLQRNETRGQAMGLIDKMFGARGNKPHCYLCAKEGHIREMELVGSVIVDMRRWNKPWSPTQNCFECLRCGRLTCWTHSDNRVPCECGAKDWVERMYLQKEIDNG